MFSVELRVNGSLIGHIYGRNVTQQSSRKEEDEYAYEYYEPEQALLIKGRVSHSRPNGLRRLVQLILNDVDAEHTKQKNGK